VLRFNGFRATALLDRDLLILDFSDQIHQPAGILFIVRRISIDLRFDNGTRQVWLLTKFRGRDVRSGETTV
jgi:hypothetical protein